MKSANELLASCPGLCGDIARYINSTLYSDEPEISLAASVAFMGALYSGRVVSPYGIEPCVYTCIIADPGRGKTQAQNALEDIIKAAQIDAPGNEFTMGKPVSDSSIYMALSKHPRRFLVWDEFGKAIASLSKSTNSHQSQILTVFMELFSVSGRAKKGGEYATRERIDTAGAYLSIFGASPQGRFFEALTPSFVEDGFLPRWLAFFSTNQIVFKKPDKLPLESIVERVQAVERWYPELSHGNLARASGKRRKLIVSFEDGEYGQLWAWQQFIQGRIGSKETTAHDKIFWHRAFEQSIKIMMGLSEIVEGVEDRPHSLVRAGSIEYAIGLTTFCVENICSQCKERLFPERSSRAYNADLQDKFLSFIRSHESVTKTQLAEKTRRWCSARDRSDVISQLLESELLVEEQYHETEFAQRKSTRYIVRTVQ